jgi:hypothetical protein
MAVDFGLLGAGGPGSIPLRANVPQMPDYTKEQQATYNLAGTMVDTREKVRTAQQNDADRQVLEAASKEHDLYSPQGLQKFLQDPASANLSVAGKQQLAGHITDLQTKADAHAKDVMAMDESRLKLYGAQLESTAPVLDSLVKTHGSTVAAKGEVAANADLQTQLGQLRGSPEFAKLSPAAQRVLSSENVDVHQIQSLLAGTAFSKTVAETSLKEAQAKKARQFGDMTFVDKTSNRQYTVQNGELADVITGTPFAGNVADLLPLTKDLNKPTAGAKNTVKQFNGPNGEMVFQDAAGNTSAVDENGERKPIPGVPAGYKPVGYVDKAAAAQTITAQLLTQPTQSLLDLAVEHVRTGKAPTLGQNSALRPAESLLAATLAQAPGGAEAAADYKRNFESLKNVTKIDDAIGSSINTAEVLLTKLEPLLVKKAIASPTDVRIVNKWINTIKRDVIGDEDLAGVDIFKKALQSDVARIQSNVSGAGGTPVAFLKNGEVIIPENMPAEAYTKIIQKVREDMDARRQGNQQKVDEIRKRVADSQKTIRGFAAEAAKRALSTDLSGYADGFGGAPAATPAPDTAPAPVTAPSPDSAMFAGDPAAARVALKKLRDDVKAGTSDKAVYDREAPALEASIVKGEALIKEKFGSYDPDAYLYRIKPDGTVQRKKK